jgi:hypothetical protein
LLSPTKVRAGSIGARKRWGDPALPRIVKIGDLTDPARRFVVLIVKAARDAEAEERAAAAAAADAKATADGQFPAIAEGDDGGSRRSPI